MILVTRLDGKDLALNSDLIVAIEACPDTTVRLSSGESLIVRERVEELVARVVTFRAEILRRAELLSRAEALHHMGGRATPQPLPRPVAAAQVGRAVQLRFLPGFEEPGGGGSSASGGAR